MNVENVDSFSADYLGATIRLAIIDNGSERRLIFASVELTPVDFPLSGTTKWGKINPKIGRRVKLLFRRIALPGSEGASTAIRWFLEAARRPSPDLPLFPGTEETLIYAPPHGCESRPEALALIPDQPFVANAHENASIGRLVSVGDCHPDIAALERSADARAWLAERIHFDPFEHREWLQGIALIAPNPVLRDFRVRLSPAREGVDGAILFQAEPRTGHDLSSLRLFVSEHNFQGMTRFEELAFDENGRAMLPKASDPWGVASLVVCPKRGVIVARGPNPFLRSARFETRMVGPERTIHVPPTAERIGAAVTSRRDALDAYSVGRERTRADAATRRVISEVSRREKREQEPNQYWFTTPEEARLVVRSLIAAARRRVVIVDEYLSAQALIEYSQSVSSASIRVRALVGRDYLKNKNARRVITAVGVKEGSETEGREFIRYLQIINKNDALDRVYARAMRGPKRPHGRYIVVDDQIWMLSESLKDIGGRPGGMVRLEDPLPVHESILDAFVSSAKIGDETGVDDDSETRMGDDE